MECLSRPLSLVGYWVLLLPGLVSHIAQSPMEWWWSLLRLA